MTEEKWKSPTGHPISSSETDAFNTRANEPDTVSVEALHRLASLEPNGFFRKGWLTAIDHLRAQYPNGVKWED